ncbi:MAG: glycosyltransferase [Bacteroidota bacterium]
MLINTKYRYKDYFESIAHLRIKGMGVGTYYWKDITRYCDYFSHEDLSVLEIGCGTGELLHGIKGKRKVGIDFSPSMIKYAREQFPDIEFHEMSAEKPDLSEKFDLIILSNLIGFIEDVQHVFHELHKVCHPKTKIIITYYNYLWEPVIKFSEWIGIKTKTPPQNWLSQLDINNLLYLAGFDVYRTTKRMLCPVYIPLISNVFNKYIAKIPIIRFFGLNTFSFAKTLPIENKEAFKEKHSVSIVIPARNESGNIEEAVLRMPVFGKSIEIIFIEGRSEDDTWQKIQETSEKYKDKYQIKIAQQDGAGKGDAVRKGFDMASGDILMILDADLTVPPEDLPKFYEAIASGMGEFINGSRLVYPMEKQAMRLLNILGNKFFSMVFSWLLDQSFKDTLCGTKVIFHKDYKRLKANRSFFGDFDPFGDFDLIFGAHKLNLKITELPIRYRERKYGTTNISRFRHGLLLLKMCFFAARKIKFY